MIFIVFLKNNLIFVRLLFKETYLIMPNSRITKLIPGSIWKHSKRQLNYLIIGIANNTDTLEKQVIYRQMYPAKKEEKSDFLKDYQLWSRSLDEFLDHNGNYPRFEYCGTSW